MGKDIHDFIHGLVPTQEKVASSLELEAFDHLLAQPDDEEEKVAYGMMGGGSEDWLSRFQHTPLYEKAIALKEKDLALEKRRMEERQRRDKAYRHDDSTWNEQDRLCLEKDKLTLELHKWRASQEAKSKIKMQVMKIAGNGDPLREHDKRLGRLKKAGIHDRLAELEERDARQFGYTKDNSILSSGRNRGIAGAVAGGATGALAGHLAKGGLKGKLIGGAIGTALGGYGGYQMGKARENILSKKAELDKLSGLPSIARKTPVQKALKAMNLRPEPFGLTPHVRAFPADMQAHFIPNMPFESKTLASNRALKPSTKVNPELADRLARRKAYREATSNVNPDLANRLQSSKRGKEYGFAAREPEIAPLPKEAALDKVSSYLAELDKAASYSGMARDENKRVQGRRKVEDARRASPVGRAVGSGLLGGVVGHYLGDTVTRGTKHNQKGRAIGSALGMAAGGYSGYQMGKAVRDLQDREKKKKAELVEYTGHVNNGEPQAPEWPRAALGVDSAGRRATPEELRPQTNVRNPDVQHVTPQSGGEEFERKVSSLVIRAVRSR